MKVGSVVESASGSFELVKQDVSEPGPVVASVAFELAVAVHCFEEGGSLLSLLPVRVILR